ncbi:HAD-IIB family hydrolase [Erythrobacter sp. LQ02-29]|uniref:HAD-IIB family hydrolase n=1 Tax=Erythrobacter sp. LQ02-29 TaxID=2920384 RepID=UPI001F4D8271|nr:HAD-IIB family hydrolase [Erythrobacter sp. LQ02-29]MCP9223714.1 HAD-IIB family hydrolase [Erythrobacter sp. LQ02-29]
MHIVSLALGGCLKGEPVRYGITEDTGGHIAYILGEMSALARRADVDLAEIVTRRFDAPELGGIHASGEEWLGPKLVVRRIDSGNPRYLAKEALGADRAAFTRAFIADLRGRERLPDLIHAHFADAADVAIQVEKELGIPFVYTAHSLGMDKLKATGEPSSALQGRIVEENRAIAAARAVIGSSCDECERQLTVYPGARVGRIHRLIPGIDRPSPSDEVSAALDLVSPQLRDLAKPMVLAIARPVRKKNLVRLVEAFGRSPYLRENCNLVVLAGLRSHLRCGEPEQAGVLGDIVNAVDTHDLYGSVAYPKTHTRQQVEQLYRLAARTGGVFVNPALTEPYGLTLVEAASHGLPVVATRNGGPQDILAELDHGILVDPRSTEDIGAAIERLVSDHALWARYSHNGRTNSLAMNWDAYAARFVDLARDVLRQGEPRRSRVRTRLVVSDLDNTLTGCGEGAGRFSRFLHRRSDFGFVVATGRSIVEARRLVRDWALPRPDAWITSVGTEIYFERADGDLVRDESFSREIEADWEPVAISSALRDIEGLAPQAMHEQRDFKRSYYAAGADLVQKVRARLDEVGLSARVVFSHERLLDILPARAGKAAAMHHVANRLSIDPLQVFAAGDSGNDADMLTACANAILVGNYAPEIAELADRANVYLARRRHGGGALEGVLMQYRARRRGERDREIAREVA